MKKFIKIISLTIIIIGIFSCAKKDYEVTFKDQRKYTIYDYVAQHGDNFSSFLSILKKGKADKILTAYNPNAAGYTLFLPDNSAVDKFITEGGKYTSLNDLLNDSVYVSALCRYHVVNLAINANDFPFGALPAFTLSGDLLTVSFITGKDTSYYKINNQAPVTQTNIELSNGYIHLIGSVLRPITYTSYNWLEQNQGYSIFKAAVDLTGLKAQFDINTKDKTIKASSFTLFLEHDSVFNKRKIYSLQDLENLISPNNTDYTNPLNPLHDFVTYHMLTNAQFLNNFVNVRTNYSTYSSIPILIDGTGLDIKINKGKAIIDTIIHANDTTFIDYVGFNYDASNLLTQSGVIHFIDHVLMQQPPSRERQTFEFYEESLFNTYRLKIGSYLIEDSAALTNVKWSGPDLFFVKTDATSTNAWSSDYLLIDGDFSISYTIPKLIQGAYTVYLQADEFSTQNAVIQVYIDGNKFGGLVDLSSGGSANAPFQSINLGNIHFLTYGQHTITVKSLIPGRFLWDYIQFDPSLL